MLTLLFFAIRLELFMWVVQMLYFSLCRKSTQVWPNLSFWINWSELISIDKWFVSLPVKWKIRFLLPRFYFFMYTYSMGSNTNFVAVNRFYCNKKNGSLFFKTFLFLLVPFLWINLSLNFILFYLFFSTRNRFRITLNRRRRSIFMSAIIYLNHFG